MFLYFDEFHSHARTDRNDKFMLCFYRSLVEPRATHSERLHEGAADSTSQAALEPMQELFTVHGATQGESSNAVSIDTASTSLQCLVTISLHILMIISKYIYINVYINFIYVLYMYIYICILIFCLTLIEVLRQLPFHPTGHDRGFSNIYRKYRF